MDAIGLLPPCLYFDRNTDARRERLAQTKIRQSEDSEAEKRLFCAVCGHVVTHQEARLILNGSHDHRFTNPQGLEFHIGCFREADGCKAVGQQYIEWSWFAGHQWQVALCRGCQTHLGWRFTAGNDGFYGLILARLSSRKP